MKQIAQCDSLSAVRDNIDRLDRQIVALIAERGAIARETGADPGGVEATWRAMISAFIKAEHEAHAALHPPSPTKN